MKFLVFVHGLDLGKGVAVKRETVDEHEVIFCEPTAGTVRQNDSIFVQYGQTIQADDIVDVSYDFYFLGQKKSAYKKDIDSQTTYAQRSFFIGGPNIVEELSSESWLSKKDNGFVVTGEKPRPMLGTIETTGVNNITATIARSIVKKTLKPPQEKAVKQAIEKLSSCWGLAYYWNTAEKLSKLRAAQVSGNAQEMENALSFSRHGCWDAVWNALLCREKKQPSSFYYGKIAQLDDARQEKVKSYWNFSGWLSGKKGAIKKELNTLESTNKETVQENIDRIIPPVTKY